MRAEEQAAPARGGRGLRRERPGKPDSVATHSPRQQMRAMGENLSEPGATVGALQELPLRIADLGILHAAEERLALHDPHMGQPAGKGRQQEPGARGRVRCAQADGIPSSPPARTA